MERHFRKLPLWPSHAERWINCPGQPRVALAAKTALGDKQSPYAAEGTRAHAYLEARLTGKPLPRIVPEYVVEEGGDPIETIDDRIIEEADKSNAEQIKIVEACARDIEDIRDWGGFTMMCEQYLTYDLAHRDVNCKVDVLLVNKERIYVIDYKHGQGWKVLPKGNPQMMLYALAAYRKYPGRVVTIGIYQPRGTGEGLLECDVSGEELTAWAEAFQSAAKRVYNHQASYTIGPWCQGCPGMHGLCPSMLSNAIDVMAEMPQPGSVDVPSEIKRPWWVLDVAEPVREFVKTICDDADAELRDRRPVPGWELRESKGRRQWANPEEVPAVLAAKLGGDPLQYCRTKVTPIGITDAEKLAKPHRVSLDGMTVAPPSFKRRRTDGPDWASEDGTEFDDFE